MYNTERIMFHLPLFRLRHFVGNKAKGRISKRAFQESKARQNFRKTNISYPLIRTRTCAYQGVRNVCFSEILTYFAFLKHPFRDSPFCLIPNDLIITTVPFSSVPQTAYGGNGLFCYNPSGTYMFKVNNENLGLKYEPNGKCQCKSFTEKYYTRPQIMIL